MTDLRALPGLGLHPSVPAHGALAHALRTLDTVLSIAVERQAQRLGADSLLDPWRGMHLDRSDVERLLAQSSQEGPTPERSSQENPIAAAVPGLLASAARTVSSLAAYEQDFGLLPDDLAILLIVAAPECDLKYEKLYGYLNDDLNLRHATPDLLANLLATDPAQRLSVMSRLDSEAPLLRAGLVAVDATANRSWLARAVVADRTWAAALLGRIALDPSLAACAQLVETPRDASDEADAALGRLHRAFDGQEGHTHALLTGPHGVGKFALAQSFAARIGKRLLVVDVRDCASPMEVRERILLAGRSARFLDAVLYLHGTGRLFQRDAQLVRALFACVGHSPVRVLLSASTPLPPVPGLDIDLVRLDVGFPSPSMRLRMWRHALAAYGTTSDDAALHPLAARFAIGPHQIRQAVRDAWSAGPAMISYDALAAATRALCGAQLGTLAQRIAPQAGFEDLVVPADVRAQLREICARVSLREAVRDGWGAGSVHARVRGVTALFAGPSGTGKTLAAEAIARELGFDLYRIDLSSIVSKYIGETEQNLDRVFAAAEHANAVLFFDEADALFGKRSEVKDAHDRYANIEVAYLLQKMESFDGLAVLATNFKQNLDEAFARRLTFTINFPFPEQADRHRLWEALWPPRAPRGADVDLEWFAREFRLSGGAIRNTVLAAAHLAAEEGQAIGRAHLLHATRREFQKLGKSIGAQVEVPR